MGGSSEKSKMDTIVDETLEEKIDSEVNETLVSLPYELSNTEIEKFKEIIEFKHRNPKDFEKIFNSENLKDYFDESYKALFNKFNDYVHPVYRHNKQIYLEHIGTCFLVAIGEVRFLVSARHIWDNYIFTNSNDNNLEKIIIEEHLACLHLNQIIPINGELIRGGLAGKRDIYEYKEEDFIVFNVTDVKFPPEIKFLNLTIQDMDINEYHQLFFIGYANSQNKKLGLHQGLVKKHVSHFLSRKLDDDDNLIYQYYPRYAESILHPKKNTIKLNGCSGCPVFSFNGNINDAQLVGMLIENSNNTITHIKIEVIFEVIMQLFFNDMFKKMIKVYYD